MTPTIKNKSASASHKISGEGIHAQEPLQGDLYRTLADRIGSSMDVTEQKQAREQLEELAALESSILDAIPQAVVGLHNRASILRTMPFTKYSAGKERNSLEEALKYFIEAKKSLRRLPDASTPLLSASERSLLNSIAGERMGGTFYASMAKENAWAYAIPAMRRACQVLGR